MALLFNGYLKRAQGFYQQQQWEDALRAAQSASHILPSARDAISCEVEILYKMKDWERAVEVLLRGLRYHPYWAWAILELSDLMINQLQEADQAWRWLQRLKLCPRLSQEETVRCCSLKVSAFLEQDRLFEASRCLCSTLTLFPRDKDLLFLQGWVELQRDNYYMAASALNRVLKQEPDYSDAHYYLGWAFRGLGEFRLMQEHYRRTYALDLLDTTATCFHPQTFRNMALEVLSLCGQTRDCGSIKLVVCPNPPASIVEDFPYDPRCMGVFSSKSHHLAGPSDEYLPPTGTLYLFQRNIERLCLTEEEVRDEILHVTNREIAAASNRFRSSEFLAASDATLHSELAPVGANPHS